MVRHMFLPFYSKERGPPRIRMQVLGVKRHRFFKVVAANQRDPQNGKHMEVLGSYSPSTAAGVEELRLRYSRIKFWLAAGAALSNRMRVLLGHAGLIPTPPPEFGWRTRGRYTLLEQVMQQQERLRQKQLREYFKTAEPVVEAPADEKEEEGGEGVGRKKSRIIRRFIR